MRRSTLSLPLVLLVLLPIPSEAQDAADPALLSEINGIRAVGKHAHVMANVCNFQGGFAWGGGTGLGR